jgi:hypothetical protein
LEANEKNCNPHIAARKTVAQLPPTPVQQQSAKARLLALKKRLNDAAVRPASPVIEPLNSDADAESSSYEDEFDDEESDEETDEEPSSLPLGVGKKRLRLTESDAELEQEATQPTSSYDDDDGLGDPYL